MHTPGPWHILGDFDADVSVEIAESSDIAIAEISPIGEEWSAEEIANAHLIAAAPELLAALKRCSPLLEPHTAALQAKAAIAKAEGRK